MLERYGILLYVRQTQKLFVSLDVAHCDGLLEGEMIHVGSASKISDIKIHNTRKRTETST